MFAAFGPDPDMQVYGRGLRRRLPPMLGGDQRWIRMAYSLMFALPGTPTLFYGEEIGMGENLDVDDRLAVRTPMQWTGARPPGSRRRRPTHSSARCPTRALRPTAVNVRDQRADPDSLLNWFERLIRLRKEAPEIGWGTCTVLRPADAVVAWAHDWRGRTLLTVHNLGRRARRSSSICTAAGAAPARPAAPRRAGAGGRRPGDAAAGRPRPPLAAPRHHAVTACGFVPSASG